MQFFTERFDDTPSPNNGATSDWTKTRRYVYHASDKLTLEQVEAVMNFLERRLSRDLARHIVQTTPRLLRKPVDSFLQPTLDFLLGLWGPSMLEEAMRRNPHLLLSSGVGYTLSERRLVATDTAHVQGPTGMTIHAILSQEAGLTKSFLQQLQRSTPFVFGLPPQKVRDVLAYLRSLLTEDSALSPEQVSKTLVKTIMAHPYLLNLAVETNLVPRVKFLQESVGLNATNVAKLLVTSNGSVLGLSVDQNLRPTVDFLKDVLQQEHYNTTPALRKCILAHPQLLGLSLTNLRSKVEYFGNPLASRIAFRCPAIYSLSLQENIHPTIDFLCKIWGTRATVFEQHAEGSEENRELGHVPQEFLQEYPNIVTLSLEGNLQPTMNFFNRTGYTLLNDDWSLTEGSPRIRGRYIAASLYNRLLPRWHYVLAQDKENNTTTTTTTASTTPEPPPLHLLASASDAVFCKELNLDLDAFEDFRKEAIPRLKFSSQFDTWLKTGLPIDV